MPKLRRFTWPSFMKDKLDSEEVRQLGDRLVIVPMDEPSREEVEEWITDMYGKEEPNGGAEVV